MLLKFIRGFSFAFSGLFVAFKSELNLKFHLLAAAAVSIAGFFFSVSQAEWIILIICFSIVISVELLNTAIEKLCDALHPEKSEKIKSVKDVSAAAVLIAAAGTALTGAIIFLPKIYTLFFS